MSDDRLPKNTPEERRGAAYAKIFTSVARNGYAVQAVFGGPHLFAYTIGLAKKYDHEIILFGVKPIIARVVLGIFADAMKEGFVFEEGRIYKDEENPWMNLPVLFRKCDPENEKLYFEYASGAALYHGFDPTVWQLVVPDKQGRFPEHPDFDHKLMDPIQPLLYKR